MLFIKAFKQGETSVVDWKAWHFSATSFELLSVNELFGFENIASQPRGGADCKPESGVSDANHGNINDDKHS